MQDLAEIWWTWPHQFPTVDVVDLASPVSVVDLAPPVGVVNLASPLGVVDLVPPVGVVNLAWFLSCQLVL